MNTPSNIINRDRKKNKAPGEGGEPHTRAQNLLADILSKYYKSVAIELKAPVPSDFILYDPDSKDEIPYQLDVYAAIPINELAVKHWHVGIELDGKIGHKNTKRQYLKDERRDKALKDQYDLHIEHFDVKDFVGKGQRIRASVKFKPKFEESDILKSLGITSTTTTTK